MKQPHLPSPPTNTEASAEEALVHAFSVTTTSLMTPKFPPYKCFKFMLPHHHLIYLPDEATFKNQTV